MEPRRDDYTILLRQQGWKGNSNWRRRGDDFVLCDVMQEQKQTMPGPGGEQFILLSVVRNRVNMYLPRVEWIVEENHGIYHEQTSFVGLNLNWEWHEST